MLILMLWQVSKSGRLVYDSTAKSGGIILTPSIHHITNVWFSAFDAIAVEENRSQHGLQLYLSSGIMDIKHPHLVADPTDTAAAFTASSLLRFMCINNSTKIKPLSNLP